MRLWRSNSKHLALFDETPSRCLRCLLDASSERCCESASLHKLVGEEIANDVPLFAM
jgi:hypothetical protein